MDSLNPTRRGVLLRSRKGGVEADGTCEDNFVVD
jgi:hypothetical protein